MRSTRQTIERERVALMATLLQHNPSNSATVVKLPRKLQQKIRPRESVSYKRRLKRQWSAACAVAGVAVVLTGLSLAHLAHGIALVTQAPTWESWAMAIGIDLGFIAMEVAQLCAISSLVHRDISRWTRPAILGTIVVSAAMNALAFGAQANGLLIYPAVGLGIAVPALVYCLSRAAFGLAASR
jgi:hypothetical protein